MPASRLVASTLALSLSLAPACKREEPAAPTAAATPSAATTEGKPPADAKTITDAKTEPAPSTPATPVATTAAALDPLLDLVPADVDEFVIVRDPKALVQGLTWFVTGERDALGRLADAKLAEWKPDAERDRIIKDFDVIAEAILGSVLQLDRGVVIVEQAGEPLLLVASPDATVIPTLVAKVTGATDTSALHCKPAPTLTGWVGCAAKEASVDGYVAANKAADRRKQLGAELAGSDLDRANLVIRVKDDGAKVATTIAIETAPGELELHVGMPQLAVLDEALATGPAPALGLVPAAGSFAWARLAPALVAKTAKDVPAPFNGAISTATGELLFAWMDKLGVVALAGVTDPSPVTGLFPFVALAGDSIPKKLPDGSGLEVTVRDLDDGSGKTKPAIVAKLTPSVELAKNLTAMGLAPEAAVFAAGGYAAVVLGGGASAIPTIGGYTGASATTETIASLPNGLQRALGDNRVEAILHVGLDGLQSPAVRTSLVDVAKLQPDAGEDVAKTIGVALDLLAPLSSVSLWITKDDASHTVHLAVRGFDDARSEEGQAARAAMLAVGNGTRDAPTAYGELATRFASSPRIASYRTRAGSGASVGNAASSAFLVGVVAAIAIPAFAKYRERAAGG